MSLAEWERNGWLRRHQAQASEIADLFAVADRDIHDSATRGLSDDWRFAIAYNASLQLARAALQAAGYETPKGEAHHFRALQSLEHTIKLDAPQRDLLDVYRKKRSASVYDRSGMISKADADDMLRIAKNLRALIGSWIRSKNPALMVDVK
jgi:hypothetical protein